MKIIIAGDGETGTHIAQMLSVENQDIVLMGSHREHLAELEATGNFITFEGSPMSRAALLRCGADRADLFVAVTPDETVNLLACEIAKDCGTRRCVARVDNPEFASGEVDAMLRRCGVDRTIYPEKLAAQEIAQFIGLNWVSEWSAFHGGELIVAGVRMEHGGTMCGHPLRDVPDNPRFYHVSAIKRGDSIIIPRGDDILLEGDTIYFSVLPADIDRLTEVDLSLRPLELQRGDVLLLCSDGISGVLTPPELMEAMSLSPEEGCALLEQMVLEKGVPGQDNYTGVLISCQ